MKQRILLMLLVLIGGLLSTLPVGATVSPQTSFSSDILVTLPDDNGILQVFRIPAIGDDGLTQLTTSAVDVEAFDVQGEDVANIAGSTLYFNNIPFQSLNRAQTREVNVHISLDNTELTYVDEFGVYLVEIESGEKELILEHIDFLDLDNPNGVGDGRYYVSAEFIEGTDDLLVTISLWEARTIGIYFRQSGEIVELVDGWTQSRAESDLFLFTRLLQLADGRLALYNGFGFGCLPCGVWVSPSLSQIGDYEQAVEQNALNILNTPEDSSIIYVPDLVVTAPSIVRLLIQQSTFDPDGSPVGVQVVADANIETGEVTPISFSMGSDFERPIFSPDGRFLLGITDVSRDGEIRQGFLSIFEIETGQLTRLDVSLVTYDYIWRWAN